MLYVRSPHLDVDASGSAYVRLVFNPDPHSGGLHPYGGPMGGGVGGVGGVYDVYLFLNDESGQNEECFLFKVSWLPQ